MTISFPNKRFMAWVFFAIVLVGSNLISYLRLAREREVRDLFQCALANKIGLTGNAPILVVSHRNYRERDIYRFSKYDYNGDYPLSTRLEYPSLDERKEFLNSTPLSKMRSLQSSTEDLLLLECRLLGEDAESLERALHIVLSKYSEPHMEEKAHTPEDIWRSVSKEISFPRRVDRARYNGIPAWIITCIGSPQPYTDDGDFSIPVSLDGRILTPAWREKGE